MRLLGLTQARQAISQRAWQSLLCPLAAALALALALLAAPRAQAQTVRTLVSNINQQVTGLRQDINIFKRATGFTTGDNLTGYSLSSIEVKFDDAPDTDVTVKLATGLPGATKEVATLAKPSTLTTGNLTFTAPAGTKLEPETQYFVIVSGGAGTVGYAQTASEDSGGLTGWSVANIRYSQSTGGWLSGDKPLLIRVKGSVNPPPVLVSTIDQSRDYSLLNSLEWAQGFTTGSETGGYTLASIDLNWATTPGDTTVKLVTGLPDATNEEATLTNPSTLAAGANTFTASEAITLSADTTYWVSVSSDGRLRGTDSSAEDDGGKDGWSVANTAHIRSRGATGAWSSAAGGESVLMRIRGTVVDVTPPVFQSATVEPGGTAVVITFDEDLARAPNLANSSFNVSEQVGSTPGSVPLDNTAPPSISGATVTLTLSGALTPGSTDRFVSYQKPTTGSDNKLADRSGNEVESFNNQPVTEVGNPTITISGGSAVTEGAPAVFTLTANPAPSANLTVNLTVSESGGGDFVAAADEGSKTVTISASATTATYSVTTQGDNAVEPNGSVTVTVATGADYTVGTTSSASVTVNDDDVPVGPPPVNPPPVDPPPDQPPGSGTQTPGGSQQQPRKPVPLQLALWTDQPGYRAGETVRLYHSLDPHDDRGQYRTFVYLERAAGGERRYLAPLSAAGELRDDPVDRHGMPAHLARARTLAPADRSLSWEGQAPAPGLWQFVLELRPGSADEQSEKPSEPLLARRAWARFAVAERSLLLNRRGFDREIREDLTLRSDTIHYLGHQLFVRDGATLTIEPGTLVRAWGQHAAIIVEPGGRIVAEGTRQAPVVLTCSVPVGRREPGCWAGLRILGRAPSTRPDAVAPGVLPPERPAYGGSDAAESGGVLRYVRVEFAGAGSEQAAPVPAIGLYGAGSGTVLDHVQAHASLGHGFAFRGGAAVCHHCVASASGEAGLAWDRGWRGGASHLFVQHGRGGGDGLSGGHDSEGHDREPRSLPILSNLTLIHASPYDRRARRAVALRLSDGSGVSAVDLLATGFGGGAVRAVGRSRQLFGEGEGSVSGALLYLNGSPQLRGGIADAVEFSARDPKLRDVRDFPNPDPRPKADSPALSREREGYIGAFGRKENWLEGWTVFGPESAYDLRNAEGSP